MALDELILSRSNQGEQKADNSESNAPDSGYEEDSASRSGNLRAAVQETKNGNSPESQGDLRADRKTASRKQGLGAKADQAMDAALAPARKSLNNLLKSSWENLIDSFGLTLIWINIHVFLNTVFGKKLFCNLGEEWLPEKPAIPGGDKTKIVGNNGLAGQSPASDMADEAMNKAKKGIGLGETMLLVLLDLIAFILILMALSLIAMIVGVVSNPMEAIKAILGSLWGAITGTK